MRYIPIIVEKFTEMLKTRSVTEFVEKVLDWSQQEFQ